MSELKTSKLGYCSNLGLGRLHLLSSSYVHLTAKSQSIISEALERVGISAISAAMV